MVDAKFSVPCGSGTLFIFTPHDDLRFCHEAKFSDACLEIHGCGGYRIAYVIRWLQSVRHFDPSRRHAMLLPAELSAKEQERKRRKRRMASHSRKQALRPW